LGSTIARRISAAENLLREDLSTIESIETTVRNHFKNLPKPFQNLPRKIMGQRTLGIVRRTLIIGKLKSR